MELLTPQVTQFLWTIIVFVLLLWVLKKFAWRPVLNTLNEREKRIEDSIKSAEKARDEAQAHLEEQRRHLENAKNEAQEIIAKGRKAAEGIKEDLITRARIESEQMLSKAQNEIALSRDKAIEEIRAIAVELSLVATQKLIRKTLTEQDHQVMVEESLKELGGLI